MKNILLILFISILFLACNNTKKEGNTVINGKFSNTTIKNILVINDSETDSIPLEKNGNFTAYLDIDTSKYIIIDIGNNIVNMYVTPGSTTSFEADYKNIDKTIKFSGDNGDINNYIYKQYLSIQNSNIVPERFPYGSSNHKPLIDAVENLVIDMENNLKNFENESGNKYSDFVYLEKQRILIIEAFLILNYRIQGSDQDANELMDPVLDEVFSKLDINNPKITNIKEFKNFAPILAVYRLNKKVLNDNYKIENSPAGFLNAYFEIIPEISESEKVLDDIYYSILLSFMEEFGVENSNEAYEKYKNFSKNKERLENLENIRFEYIKLNPGMPSVNFSFPDINGKYYSLNDFKGKYVYIDVWATWCGPCRGEIPYLKSLKEKFKSKNIEIIGVSVDENKTQWENMVKSENMTGIQLYAGGWNNPLTNFFRIKGIPRFILLDKDGNIINSDAQRPSGDIENILNSLEGI